jgi:hypothetical protein
MRHGVTMAASDRPATADRNDNTADALPDCAPSQMSSLVALG